MLELKQRFLIMLCGTKCSCLRDEWLLSFQALAESLCDLYIVAYSLLSQDYDLASVTCSELLLFS